MNLIEYAFSKKDFERVIELCDEIPKNQMAIDYKATSLRLMDRPQEALDVLDTADYPDNPYHHYIRAEAGHSRLSRQSISSLHPGGGSDGYGTIQKCHRII